MVQLVEGATSSTWTTSGDGTFNNVSLLNAVYTPGANDLIAGTVTLTLTTDDPAGPCVAENDQMVITITDDATADAGSDQTICETETVQLSGSIGGGASSLTWTTSGDGTFNDATSATAIYTPGTNDIASGSVTLTLTTDDPAGPCNLATDQMVVTVNDQPEVDANADQTICETETVQLNGSIGGGATSATWTTAGDGTFNNASVLNAIYTPGTADIAAGTVTLTLTTDDPAGPCVAESDQMVVTINDQPEVDANADQTICETETVSLSGTIGGGASSATWTTSGDGTFNNASALNAIYTPGTADIAAGTVTLTLTTDDPTGPCVAESDQMVVTINDQPEVNAGSDQSICEGTTAQLNGTIGGGASSATWSTSGDGTFNNASALNAIYTPGTNDLAAGTVTLTLTTNDPAGPCVAENDQMVITISDDATADAGADQTICETETVSLNGTIGGGATSLTWTTSGDGTFNNATSATAIYTPGTNDIANGSVTLTLTTNDPAGPCNLATDQMVVTITDEATADAGSDQTICEGDQVNLVGSIGGGATASSWSTSGDGSFNNTMSLNAIYTPGPSDISAGSVTLTLTTNDPAGPCVAVSDDMVVTINPAAVVSAGADQTICEDETATLSGSISGGATSATWSTSGDGTFNNVNSLTAIYTPGANDITNGQVTLTLTTNDPAGPCPAVSDQMLLNINDKPETNAGVDQTICETETVSLSGTIGGGASSATWTTSGDGTFNDATSLSAIYTPGSTDKSNGTVTLTLTTNDPVGPCPAVSDQMVVTINDQPEVNAGTDQTICETETVSLSGTIGGGASSATWTTSGDGSFNDATALNAIYTPGTTDKSNGTVTLTLTTDDPAGPCVAESDQMVVTINDQPEVNAGSDQSICEGTTATLNGSIGGGASSATWTTAGDGTFNNANALNAIYTPGTNDLAAGTVTLTLTTDDPAGPCVAESDQMVLTITDDATADAGSDQTICETETVSLSGTIGGGATSLTWTTSGDGTFNDATSATAIYTPGATDISNGSVTLTLTTDDPAGPCNAASDQMVVTINDQPEVNANADQTICETETVSLSGTIGGGASSATWTTSGDGTFNNASALNAIYTPGSNDIAAGTVTLTLTTDDPAGPCVAESDQMVVTINDQPEVNAGSDQSICEGTTATLNGSIGGGASSATWTTAGDGTFNNANALNAIYTPGTNDLAAGTVTLTLTTDDPAGPCVAESDQMILTITDDATADAGSDQTICETETVQLSGSIGGGASSSTWTTSGDGTFNDATSATAIYTPGTNDIASGSVTLTLTTDDPAGPCNLATDQMVVTINDQPEVDANADQTICETETVQLNGSIGGGATSATWSTAGDGTFNNASALNAIYTPGTADIAAGTVTLTLTTDDPAGPCVAESDQMVVTINDQPEVDANADQTICETETVSLSGTIGGGASSSTWTTSGDGTFNNASALNAIYTPGTADIAAGTVTLTLTTDDPAGPCVAESDQMVVTINDQPEVNAGSDQSICEGTTAQLNGTIGGGASSATWSTSGDGTFNNASALNAIYTPGTNDLAAGTVTLTLTTNDPAGPCVAENDQMVITISDDATADAGADQTICETETVSLNGTIGGGATSLTWTTSGDGTFNNATSATAIYTPGTNDIANGSVTLTLTTNDPAGPCNLATDQMVVTITDEATADAGSDQTICEGDQVNLVGSIGGGATASSWSTSGDGSFNNTMSLNAIYTPGPSDISAGSVTLTLTTNDPAGPCVAVSDDMVVTINPAAVVSAGADQTICEDETATLSGSISGGATSATWSTSGDGTFNNVNSLTAIYTPGANDITNGQVTLTLTTNDPSGPCPAVSDQMLLNINDKPETNAGVDQTICETETVSLSGTIGGGASSATWTTSGDGTFNDATSLSAIYTPGSTDKSNGTVTLTLTTNDPVGPCPAVSDQMVVTINDQPEVNAGTDQTICETETVSLSGTIGGGASSATWTTSGDGSFNDATALNAIYTPGTTDKSNGTVTLTLTTDDPAGPCVAESDQMVVTINDQPEVNAGSDQSICEGTTATLNGSIGGGASSATWTTAGDGTFNNANALNAIYTPGTNDLAAGTVTLTLTTDDPAGPCVAESDQMVLTITDDATADAGTDQTICETETVSLSGTIGGGATSLTWTTSGDGTFNDATSATAIYTPGATDISNGSVTLTLTTDDPAGPCNAASDQMVVTINDQPEVNASADQTICETETVQLSGSIGGGASSATWTTSGDGTFNNASALNAIYTPGSNDIAAGTVTLTLTTDDPAGPCVAESDQMVVTINDQPEVNAGSDQSICEGTTATLNGSIGGGASSATWTTAGDGTFNNASALNAIYTPGANDLIAGTVTLTLTTDDPAGPCVAENDQMVITITDDATADAGSDQTICETETVQLSGSIGGGASSLTWTTSGDGTFNDATSATAIYTPGTNDIASGSVTLTLTTDDPAGPCNLATDQMVVTINDQPEVDANADQTICETETVQLNGSIGGGATSATWTTAGDGTFNNASVLNAIYTPGTADIAAGTVTLTLTTDDPAGPCVAESDQMVVTINDQPEVDANADQTICETETVSLSGTIGGGASSATWTTAGDGTFNNASALNAIYTPGTADIAAGTVTLTLTTDDPTGPCVAESDQMVVTINDQPEVDANADQTICETETVSLSGTIGGGASSATWTTAGDGTFNNASALNAIYTPGTADIAAGTVTLTLTTDDPTGPCVAEVIRWWLRSTISQKWMPMLTRRSVKLRL